MRYHAEWKDNQNNIENEKRLQSLAVVKKIKPSLEDVFIRIVEGRNR